MVIIQSDLISSISKKGAKLIHNLIIFHGSHANVDARAPSVSIGYCYGKARQNNSSDRLKSAQVYYRPIIDTCV